MLDHLVQKITDTQSSGRRDRHRIAHAQIVKFIGIHQEFFKIIHFVYCQDHRLGTAAQHVRYLCIRILQSLTYIHHKNDHVRRINGYLRLFSHLRNDHVPAFRFDTARIHHGKRIIQPSHICINTVTGHTWRIFYNGDILSRQGIKQCGFAHIWTSHNCYYWSAHILNLFLLILD